MSFSRYQPLFFLSRKTVDSVYSDIFDESLITLYVYVHIQIRQTKRDKRAVFILGVTLLGLITTVSFE